MCGYIDKLDCDYVASHNWIFHNNWSFTGTYHLSLRQGTEPGIIVIITVWSFEFDMKLWCRTIKSYNPRLTTLLRMPRHHQYGAWHPLMVKTVCKWPGMISGPGVFPCPLHAIFSQQPVIVRWYPAKRALRMADKALLAGYARVQQHRKVGGPSNGTRVWASSIPLPRHLIVQVKQYFCVQYVISWASTKLYANTGVAQGCDRSHRISSYRGPWFSSIGWTKQPNHPFY